MGKKSLHQIHIAPESPKRSENFSGTYREFQKWKDCEGAECRERFILDSRFTKSMTKEQRKYCASCRDLRKKMKSLF